MCDKKHSFINFGCFNFSKVDRILSIILRRLEKQVLAFVKKKKNFFFCLQDVHILGGILVEKKVIEIYLLGKPPSFLGQTPSFHF